MGLCKLGIVAELRGDERWIGCWPKLCLSRLANVFSIAPGCATIVF